MKLYDIPDTQFSIAIRKFASSVFYPIFIALICYISWAYSLVFLGLWIATALFALLMVTQRNSIYVFPILILIFYIFPDFKEAYYWAGVNLGLCVLAVLYNIIVYKVKLNKGGLFYPIMATFFAAAVGGIIYTTITYGFVKYIKDTLFILMLTASFGGGYLFLNNTVSTEDIDYKKYISLTFCCLAALLIAEMITYFARADNVLEAIKYKTLRVGWGNTNTMATALMLTVPFFLYISTQYRYGAFFLLGAFLVYGAIWITESRGCIIASTPILLFYFIYLAVKSKGFKRYTLITVAAIFVSAVITLIIVFRSELYELFSKMFAKGLDDTGRVELYQEAWNLFKKHYIFGTGYFYRTDKTKSFMYMFHSTPLQIMANLGLVGVLAFAYFYYHKYKILFKNLKSSFGIAIIGSILSIEIYGLIDVSLVVYYLAITTILLLIIAQKNIADKNTDILRKEND
ncbi:MAG TPA: O-antigen ligase family protein [Clostridia bacterium]